MAHPYLKARTKQKWIESAKHLRIPPSPTVWACGFSRGSVKIVDRQVELSVNAKSSRTQESHKERHR